MAQYKKNVRVLHDGRTNKITESFLLACLSPASVNDKFVSATLIYPAILFDTVIPDGKLVVPSPEHSPAMRSGSSYLLLLRWASAFKPYHIKLTMPPCAPFFPYMLIQRLIQVLLLDQHMLCHFLIITTNLMSINLLTVGRTIHLCYR